MYLDTKTSRKIGKLSSSLLELITEAGARRKDNEENVYIRPRDFALFEALSKYFTEGLE
jgi:hypothetical protein